MKQRKQIIYTINADEDGEKFLKRITKKYENVPGCYINCERFPAYLKIYITKNLDISEEKV